LAQVWPLFSNRVFIDVMRDNQWGLLIVGPLYGWVCVAIGGLLVALVIAAIVSPPKTIEVERVVERVVEVEAAKRSEQKPNLSYEPFDGARAGLEIFNTGGECRVKAKVQIESCKGRNAELRHRDKHSVYWEKSRHRSDPVVMTAGDDDKVILATYQHWSDDFSRSGYKVSVLHGPGDAIQSWDIHSEQVDAMVLLVEIATDPWTMDDRVRFRLTFDHAKHVINMVQLQEPPEPVQ
jgi:hypothetical protein